MTERRKVKQVISTVLPTLDKPSVEFLTDKIIEVFDTTRPLPTSSENDSIEELVKKLEIGLKFNFPRSVKDQRIYRKLLQTGKPIDLFISWVLADDNRKKFSFLYAKNTETIWRDFPQAFTENNNNPLGLEVGI